MNKELKPALLTRSEIDYLQGKEISNAMRKKCRFMIRRKLKVFAELELPLIMKEFENELKQVFSGLKILWLRPSWVQIPPPASIMMWKHRRFYIPEDANLPMQIGLHDDSINVKRKRNNRLVGKSIDNYDLGFKSEATKETYHKKLKQFLEYVNLDPDEFLERTKANPKIEGCKEG